jgi:glycosyltransferase involved in cell wall biosynthesis
MVGHAMRTAVYNRYWATGGGAEKYGAVMAQVLSGDGPLDLLTHDPVDVDWLGDRLHVELSKVGVRTVDDEPGAVTQVARDYDLFVNVSYMSPDPAPDTRSLYVVHFPPPLDGHVSSVQKMLGRAMPWLHRGADVRMQWGQGFYHREPGSGGIAWTSGDARLRFVTNPAAPVTVLLAFGHQRPAGIGPTPVRIEVDGEVRSELILNPPRSRLDGRRSVVVAVEVRSPEAGVPVEMRIVSDTFVPSDVLGGSDHRRLGVPLKWLDIRTGWTASIHHWLPLPTAASTSAEWTESYGALVANSEFTQRWVDRYWGCDSEVVYPPVTMHAPAPKEPIILSVGRFFPADMGHSKKQLELVWAFRTLVDQGVCGWALHLVGGCSDAGRSYLDAVRRAADGYPVQIHVDATGPDLEVLYGAASIYWHAAGLGEDPERHPGRLEHFGITTVEAMSAGVVPVVIGLAGQLETVRHGVDGLHFQTLGGLISLTRQLIDDQRARERMATSAAARARTFDIDAFELHLRGIVDRLVGEP